MLKKINRYLSDFHNYWQFGFLNAFKLSIIAPRMDYSKRVRYEADVKREYLNKIVKNIKLEDECVNEQNNEGPIWVCWWQGEKNMPPVVKTCWKKLIANSKGRKVILITEKNFFQYVSLPQTILDKFINNYITITQLSIS